jgi:hypothetical protein
MCGSKSVTIVVSATSASPFPPTISDGTSVGSTEEGDENLTTNVGSGYTVVIKMAGDISSINNVYSTNGVNLFSSGPSRQSDGSWSGVIGALPKGTVETYSINYTVGGNTYIQDPKIMINS